MPLPGWMVAVMRIELRDLVANRWRSILLGILVAIPVAGMVAVSNLAFITEATPEERATERLGTADFLIDSQVNAVELESSLPHGSTIECATFGSENIISGGSKIRVETARLNLNGMAVGMFELVEGRLPEDPHEIAVSTQLLQWLGLECGAQIKLSGGRECTIAGIVENPNRLSQLQILYSYVPEANIGDVCHFVLLPPDCDRSEVKEGLANNVIEDRAELIRPQQSLSLIAFGLGVLALVEAALIIMSSFFVGVRRRRRELGLLASCGASQLQLLVSVVMAALTISLVASVVGYLIGVLLTVAAVPFTDSWNGRRNGSFEFTPGVYGLAILFGVLVATLSALLPALSVARLPVKTALSSRRPPAFGSGKLALFGLVVLGAGFWLVSRASFLQGEATGDDADNAALQSILLGSILGFIGFGAWSPWLLQQLSGLASFLSMPWRLAIRECGRFCTRYGPIATAILAGTALSITVASLQNSISNLQDTVLDVYHDDQMRVFGPASEQIAERIAAELEGICSPVISAQTNTAAALVVKEPADLRLNSSRLLLVNEALLGILHVDDPDRQIMEKLNAGNILSLVDSDQDEVEIINKESRETVARLPTFKLDGIKRVSNFGYATTALAIERFGRPTERLNSEAGWLVRAKLPLNTEAIELARQIAAEYPQSRVESKVDVKADSSGLFGMFLVAILTGTLIIGSATALANEESRADQQTLLVVGAPPIVHRNISVARSTYLAMLGCTLAVPAGLLPAYGICQTIPFLNFSIPLGAVAIAVIGLPVIAFVGTWVVSSFGTCLNTSKA